MIIVAREAALAGLLRSKWIVLPRQRRSATVVGISGTTYEAWVELPEERVELVGVELVDVNLARITLDDGRVVQVQVVAQLGAPMPERLSGVATIQIVTDDPEVAGLSLDELRKRMDILTSGGQWCIFWSQDPLLEAARVAAQEEATEKMDWLLPGFDLENVPASQQRETLLHYYAKMVLAGAKKITVPGLVAEVSTRLSDQREIAACESLPAMTLNVVRAEMEFSEGTIRPDLALWLEADCPEYFNGRLLVEITVTHGINPERKQRIENVGVASIEVCLDRTGGALTLDDFRLLLVENLDVKRWIYHPFTTQLRKKAEAKLEQLVIAQEAIISDQRKEQERDRFYDDMPEWAIAQRLLSEVRARAEIYQATFGDIPPKTPAQDAAIDELVTVLLGRGVVIPEYDYLFSETGVVTRILSFKHNKPVGYKYQTAWQVFNSILSDGQDRRPWHPVYAVAIDYYRIPFGDKYAARVDAWKRELRHALKEYPHRFKYDACELLALMFPELKSRFDQLVKHNRQLTLTGDPYRINIRNASAYAQASGRLVTSNARKISKVIDTEDFLHKAGIAAANGVTPGDFARKYALENDHSSGDLIAQLRLAGLTNYRGLWN